MANASLFVFILRRKKVKRRDVNDVDDVETETQTQSDTDGNGVLKMQILFRFELKWERREKKIEDFYSI